jgi:hypothetical protein
MSSTGEPCSVVFESLDQPLDLDQGKETPWHTLCQLVGPQWLRAVFCR